MVKVAVGVLGVEGGGGFSAETQAGIGNWWGAGRAVWW
jgi:hypothetical protein